MDHSRKMLRFRDMLLFLNPPTQHEALLRARSASLRCARNDTIILFLTLIVIYILSYIFLVPKKHIVYKGLKL